MEGGTKTCSRLYIFKFLIIWSKSLLSVYVWHQLNKSIHGAKKKKNFASLGVHYKYCKLSINNAQYHHQYISIIFNLASSVSVFLCIMSYCDQQRKLL